MQGGIRLSDGRVLAEDGAERLYGPLGANVVAFVTSVVADWGAVESRLAVTFAKKMAPAQRKPFSLDEVRSRTERYRADERPGDTFSSAAAMTTTQLGQVAKSAGRENLREVGLMFIPDSIAKPTGIGRLVGDGLRGNKDRDRVLAELGLPRVGLEVLRAILAVGLRDLLTPADADPYFERWTEVTGVAVT